MRFNYASVNPQSNTVQANCENEYSSNIAVSIRAFTLIELLIVVAIIGILAAIAIPNFQNAQLRAKLSRCAGDLRTLSTALDMYRLDNKDYPGGAFWDTFEWWHRHSWRYHVLTTPIAYITEIPLDPFQTDALESVKKEWAAGNSGAALWDGGYVYQDLTLAVEPVKAYGDSFVYIVASWGPDQDWESWGAWHKDRPYNPSNGLRSKGDIVFTGPGGTLWDHH